MNNPPDLYQSVYLSILTDFEGGLSVSSVKTAIDSQEKLVSLDDSTIS